MLKLGSGASEGEEWLIRYREWAVRGETAPGKKEEPHKAHGGRQRSVLGNESRRRSLAGTEGQATETDPVTLKPSRQ